MKSFLERSSWRYKISYGDMGRVGLCFRNVDIGIGENKHTTWTHGRKHS